MLEHPNNKGKDIIIIRFCHWLMCAIEGTGRTDERNVILKFAS